MALSTFSWKERNCSRRSSQRRWTSCGLFRRKPWGDPALRRIVAADALVSCVGMMVRNQKRRRAKKLGGDARERSSVSRFNPHPAEARTRSSQSVTPCPISVCLQGGTIEERKTECLSVPTGEILKAERKHHTWSLTVKRQIRQPLITASRDEGM